MMAQRHQIPADLVQERMILVPRPRPPARADRRRLRQSRPSPCPLPSAISTAGMLACLDQRRGQPLAVLVAQRMRRIEQADGSHGGDLHRLRLRVFDRSVRPRRSTASAFRCRATAERSALVRGSALRPLRRLRNSGWPKTSATASCTVRPNSNSYGRGSLLAMVGVDPDLVVAMLAAAGRGGDSMNGVVNPLERPMCKARRGPAAVRLLVVSQEIHVHDRQAAGHVDAKRRS